MRWYLRYPPCQDVADLLEERGIAVDRSTVYRWVQKFGQELAKRTEKHLRWASVDWHVDEPISVLVAPSHRCKQRLPGSEWRYLWRAINANAQIVDFRPTARRDAKAARAFLRKAIERVRLHRPVTIRTDKTPWHRRLNAGLFR